MRLYLISSSHTVEPFGTRACELPVFNRPLADWQDQVARRLGFEPVRISSPEEINTFPCLAASDDLFFTAEALSGFVQTARQPANLGANMRAALRCSELTESYASAFQGELLPLGDGTMVRAYDAYYLNSREPGRPLNRQSQLCSVPYALAIKKRRINRFFDSSERLILPRSRVVFQPIVHWPALINVNALGMWSLLRGEFLSRKWDLFSLPFKLLARAGSLRPKTLGGKLYLAGRNCRVHPTAHVEGCILGEDIRIGPHATVRWSVIGDCTEVGPSGVVEGCTLGRDVTIHPCTTVRGSVVFEGACIGTYLNQLSVIGKNSVICPSAGLLDFNLRSEVMVRVDGKQVPAGTKLLGGCLGHGSFLGPLVVVAAGQSLPNGCVLVQHPRDCVTDIEQRMPEGLLRLDPGRKEMRRTGRERGRALRQTADSSTRPFN